jgi:hypothetical protein
MVTFDDVRALALALPQVEEATSYGTPAFKLRGQLIARLREEGDVLVVKAEIGHRDALIAARPDVYFVTPHDHDSRYVLVRLPAVDAPDLADLLADAWAMAAPKRRAANLDQAPRPIRASRPSADAPGLA